MKRIYDICEQIRATTTAGKASKSSPSIVEGLLIKTCPAKTGVFEITPEQILSILVENVTLNGALSGYQRDHAATRSRKIANALARGESIAEPTLGYQDGQVYATDGQHRLIGAVIARKPIRVVCLPMGEQERATRFAQQRLAVRPPGDISVIALDHPISRHLKTAIEKRERGDMTDPWSRLVGLRTDDTYIGIGSAFDLLSGYLINQIGASTAGRQAQELPPAEQRRVFKADLANEMAELLLAFGTKATAHPVVYRPATLRALTDLSIAAVRRSQKHDQDFKRWQTHMPRFDFSSLAWATRHNDIRPPLVAHWNKRLPDGRKVQF